PEGTWGYYAELRAPGGARGRVTLTEEEQPMRVLVTGGAGFIGTNLVRLLIRERSDWQVEVLDLLTYAGNYENLSELIEAGRVRFHRVDLRNLEAVKGVFSESPFDLIFHLAAESHVDRSLYSASTFASTNVLGTQHLIDA